MALFQAQQEQFERRSPIGQWQVVTVTFDAAGTDVVVRHSLPAPLPEQIDYQVLRANGPIVVYHDGTPSRRKWGDGFVVLRSSIAGVTADIQLTVSAEPIFTRTLPAGVVTTPSVNADTLDGLDSSAFARANEPFIVKTPSAGLTSEFALSSLSTGLLKVTTGTGDLTVASAGTDYADPANAAPASAQYLTLATDATLSNERVFTPGVSLLAVDGGAGSTYTLGINRVFARKTADETVTSSTALQDDDHLSVAIGASETWEYRLHLVFDAVSAGDFQFAFNVPASATGLFSYISGDATTATNLSAGASTDLTDTGTKTVGGNGAGVLTSLFVSLVVINSTNAGNVKLRWAQGTSSGTGTILKTNSYIIGHRLA